MYGRRRDGFQTGEESITATTADIISERKQSPVFVPDLSKTVKNPIAVAVGFLFAVGTEMW